MSDRLRIINLGLPKSGTTTLGHALKLAGIKTADYRIRPHQVDDPERHRQFVGELLYQGYFHTGDPLALMPEFDAFTEINVLRGGKSLWPQMDWGLIDAIRQTHPGARFVATWRDPRALSDSMLGWSNLGSERLPEGDIPGLPAGFGVTTQERMRWITAHYNHLDRLFQGDTSYLRLEVADEQAKDRLSAHIGREVTWWGRRNVSNKSSDEKAA